MNFYKLYKGAEEWAKKGQFRHSVGDGSYGELLFAGISFSGPKVDVKTAVREWMDEAEKYVYVNPRFSEFTEGFVQVVWKATTQVGCATTKPPTGTIIPGQDATFIVCRYSPPGNVANEYKQNVGQLVK